MERKALADYVGTDGFVSVPLVISDGLEFDLFPGLLPNVYEIREMDFPLLDGLGRVYLDNTATSQEPQSVKSRIHAYRSTHIRGSNHSENSFEAREAQRRNDEARWKVQRFFNASDYIVGFTGGTTDTSNYVATRFPFEKGDVLILTEAEHNSQLLTARNFARMFGARVHYVPVSLPEGRLDLDCLKKIVAKAGKGKVLMNLIHASNVTGVVTPVKEIREILGGRAFIYLDMAQSAGHMPVDLDDLDVDFAGISAHKMYGPMGIGAVFINKASRRYVGRNVSGGSAVRLVSKWFTAHSDVPARFEPGTQDLEGALEWGFAIDYLNGIGMGRIAGHDKELGRYFLGELLKIEGMKIYGPREFRDRIAVVTFNNTPLGSNHEEFAVELNKRGISVRDGCFCAHMYTSQLLGAPRLVHELRTLLMSVGFPEGPLMIPGAVRASFAFYNTLEDAYGAVRAIREITAGEKRKPPS